MGLEEKKTGKVHGLTLKERKYGKLTGVQDIHSFNENEILLQTEAGKVQIKGEQLHVKSLDLEKGEAEIEGKVNSVSYLTKNAQKKEEPLLKRMWTALAPFLWARFSPGGARDFLPARPGPAWKCWIITAWSSPGRTRPLSDGALWWAGRWPCCSRPGTPPSPSATAEAGSCRRCAGGRIS